MKRVTVVVVLVVVLGLLTASVSAGQPDATSRFWLASYDPPRFAVQAQLVDSQMDVVIKYTNGAFEVGFSSASITPCLSSALTATEMEVLASALDFAVQTAGAMP